MSLPPQVIQVKRKRTEEGPVPSFLRIEHATNKRHRSDAFFYRRHDPQAAAAAQAAKRAAEAEAEANGSRATRPPTIQSTKKGDEKRKAGEITTTPTKPTPNPTAPENNISTLAAAAAAAAEPRRFHLSRDSLMAAHSNAASVLGVSGAAGVRKRSRYSSAGGDAGGPRSGEPAAVFVERSKRQLKHKLRRNREGKTSGPTSGSGVPKTTLPSINEPVAPLPKRAGRRAGATPRDTGSGASTNGASTPALESADSAAGTGTSTTTQSSTPALPPSLRNRQWDTDMDQLTRDMNDYTLEIIGRNLAAQQQRKSAADLEREKREAERQQGEMSRLANERRKAAYAKYKPKVPAQRHAEKGAAATDPEEGNGSDATLDEDEDENMSDTDEDDYVTETYVRVPGHEAAKEGVANGAAVPGSVGLLVFDNEPDMEFFYGVEEDSDEDDLDDEDENAENYYTHDYPEDEVSSDDEYDRAAYHYRTGNASDLEEFADSDVEAGGDDADDKQSGDMIGFTGNIRLTKPGDL